MRFTHVWCINLNLLQVKDKVHVLLMFVLQALQQTLSEAMAHLMEVLITRINTDCHYYVSLMPI